MSSEEKAAYQRGYTAGRRRAAADVVKESKQAEAIRFRDQAFLAVLGAVLQTTWNQGKEVSLRSKVAAAWLFAEEARRTRKPF